MGKDNKEKRQAKRTARRNKRQERKEKKKALRLQRKQSRKENKGKLKESLGKKIQEFLDHEFDKIKQERELQVQNSQAFTQQMETKKLIQQYLFKGVTSAVKSGILPGFVGMVTIVPEIVGNVKNQMRLVYDVGLANGYNTNTHKDVIIYVLLDALGKKTFGMGIIQGNQIVIRQNSDQTLGMIVKVMAGYVISQLARSLICKWLPGLGSMAMMAWAHSSIMKVATNSNQTFQKELVYSDTPPVAMAATPASNARIEVDVDDDGEDDGEGDMIKFLTLIDLMKVDGKIQESERKLFLEMLSNSDFDEEEKQEILEELDSEEESEIELDYFKENEEERIGLILDLVALCKADNNIHIKELGYILDVAEQIGFSKEEVMSMLEM